MHLTTACLARNEASRFLTSALGAWKSFSDVTLLLDDGSEDDTAAIAEAEGAVVIRRSAERRMWGSETQARKQLWDAACSVTPDGGWIFICDADQVPARGIRPLLETEPEAIAFCLYDIWGSTQAGQLLYRDDNFWAAHIHPRVWLVRKRPAPPGGWRFPPRGIHTGHLPANFPIESVLFAPKEYSLLHYGYSTSAIREEKLERYRSVAEQLTAFERAHAESIADPEPRCLPLPFTPELTLQKTEAQPCLSKS